MGELERQFAALEKRLTDSVKQIAVAATTEMEWSVTKRVTERGAFSAFGSPVDTGFYAKNHNVAFGTPDRSVSAKDIGSEDVSGILREMKLGQPIFITNSVSYARALQDAPSPLEKTSGDMYLNAAEFAVASMNNYGKKEAVASVKKTPARPVKMKVAV